MARALPVLLNGLRVTLVLSALAILLSLVWGLATVGILCKWLFPLPSPTDDLANTLSMSLYLAVGIMGFLPAKALLRAVGARGVLWAFAGCLLYTIGGLCDAQRWPVLVPGVIGGHEVLHILDIGATLTHVYFVVYYVVPFRAEEPAAYLADNPCPSLAD